MESHEKDTSELSRADFLGCLHRTFSSADGRTVLAWLHSAAATGKPSFFDTGRPIDPYLAATRDGRKAIVLEIEQNLRDARSNTPDAKPKATGAPGARRKGA